MEVRRPVYPRLRQNHSTHVCFRRRKTGFKNELHNLLFRHRRQFAFGRQTFFQNLGADFLNRKAFAVVDDVDDEWPPS